MSKSEETLENDTVARTSVAKDRKEQFDNHVVGLARNYFGKDNVKQNHELERTNSTVDLFITTPWVDMACEVCYEWSEVLEAVGKAMLYSNHTKNTVACVLVPSGSLKKPEAEMLRYTIPVIEISSI